MPVCLDLNHLGDAHRASRKWTCGQAAEFPGPASGCLSIGLINNMPDAALTATENQFLSLLDSASGAVPVRLSLYALPGVPRKDAGRRHIRNFYSSVKSLRDKRLDGLIVTG